MLTTQNSLRSYQFVCTIIQIMLIKEFLQTVTEILS